MSNNESFFLFLNLDRVLRNSTSEESAPPFDKVSEFSWKNRDGD